MDIAWIQGFVAVIRYGGFTEAAEALFVSQSVISKQVSRLEKELHVTLFDRSRRRAVLTPIGEKILPEAQRLLEQYAALQTAACAEPPVRLAVLPVADCYGFPRLLASFENAHPGICFSIQEYQNAAVPALLASGQCDGAFYRVLDNAPIPPNSICLATDELVLLVPASGGSASQPTVLREWSNHDFLLLDAGTGLLQASIELCSREGFRPNIRYTGASERNIRQMLRQGEGVALLAEQVAQSLLEPGLELLHITPTVHSYLLFALSDTAIPAAQTFFMALSKAKRK